MDRRYYGIKALVVAVGVGLALASSLFGTPRLSGAFTHAHYAAVAEPTQRMMAETAVQATHAVADFIRRQSCVTLDGF